MNRIKQNVFLLSLGALLALVSCGKAISSSPSVSSSEVPLSSSVSSSPLTPTDQTLYEAEMSKSFAFFWDYVSSNKSSPAYGLVADRARGNIASTASTGFGLAALPIGVERGYVSKADAEARALITLQNVNKLTNLHGFRAQAPESPERRDPPKGRSRRGYSGPQGIP